MFDNIYNRNKLKGVEINERREPSNKSINSQVMEVGEIDKKRKLYLEPATRIYSEEKFVIFVLLNECVVVKVEDVWNEGSKENLQAIRNCWISR